MDINQRIAVSDEFPVKILGTSTKRIDGEIWTIVRMERYGRSHWLYVPSNELPERDVKINAYGGAHVSFVVTRRSFGDRRNGVTNLVIKFPDGRVIRQRQS